MSSQTKQTLVTRTYQMGVRFEGTREKRRIQEKEANQRVKGLQVRQEDLIHDKKAINAALSIARNEPKMPNMVGLTNIKRITKKSPSIADSAYTYLFLAAKGTVTLERKVEVFFDLMSNWKEQAIEWYIFGRSPRIESILIYRWKVKRLYVINVLTSTRRQIDKFCNQRLKFNTMLPLLAQKEFERAIQKCNKSKCLELTSKPINSKTNVFLENLRLLALKADIVAPLLTSWNNTVHPSRWKSLKFLSKRIAESIGEKNRRLFSALRAIVIFALYSTLEKTVIEIIQKTHPTKIVHPPFRKKKKGRLPIQLIMCPKHVVLRPGSSKVMTELARKDGYFELGFVLRGFPRITCKLIFSKKILEYLNKGARIRSLLIRSNSSPSYKVRVSVIIEGTPSKFLSTKLLKQLSKKGSTKKVKSIGVDINRVSEHMIALSNKEPLSKNLLLLARKYNKLSNVIIPQLSYSLTNKGKKKDTRGYVKTKGELYRVYRRRKNILEEIKNFATHFIAAEIVKNKSNLLCVEDFQIDPRGKRGALAKAIYNMPDNQEIFEKAVLLASSILGYKVKLVYVNPRGTSTKHNGCGGKVERKIGSYDIAKCKKCGKMVNTHINAAKNVKDKGEQLLKSNSPSPHTRGTR